MPYKNYAEFARTKGAKDKGKRKSRAGAIAGGIAGAGALGLGARYGGAEISSRLASRTLDKPNSKGMSQKKYLATRKAAESGGAGGLLSRDLKKASNARKGLQSGIAGSAAGRYVSGKADAVAKSKFGKGVASKYAGLKDALLKERGTNKIVGKTLGGRLARGSGLLAAAGSTAAVLNYLKNRKKNKK